MPSRGPSFSYARCMSEAESQGWGVEYRREGDDAPQATTLRVPSTLQHEPWTREAAEAIAAGMLEEGGYSFVRVVPLPYSSD